MNENLNRNKKNAIDFYRMAYDGKSRRAVELYVGSGYIQHNPLVGDLVALHTHQTWPGNEEYVTMDFFRFDNLGKIVEHWDAMQIIPSSSANNNTMY